MSSNRYFGTNGIRGILGHGFFTLDFVCDMTSAIARHMITKQKYKATTTTVLIGYDGRITGPLICNAVSASLNYTGVNCAIAGMLSTPCLEYEVKKSQQKYAGGIMITASHNPPEYNGIKVVASDGIEISRADELQIEKLYHAKNTHTKPQHDKWGNTTYKKDSFAYIPDIISHIDQTVISTKKLKIVIDPGNGIQGLHAIQLCKELNCTYIMINDSIDGEFPGRGPEPTPENLSQLSRTVVENDADFGIAFDGDGDRSIFCDEKGHIIIGDRSALVLIKHIFKNKKRDHTKDAKIATCLNSSSAVEKVAGKLNANVVRTKIGSVEVSQCMKDTGAIIGYEENGGFMYGPHNAVRDGCMTLALMLDMLANSKNMTLSENTKSLPLSYTAKSKVRCAYNATNAVMLHMRDILDVSDDRDGLKTVLSNTKDRWVLIRPSGTEPAIRVYAEATTQTEANNIVKQYADKLLHLEGVSIY